MNTTAAKKTPGWTIFMVACVYLILIFLWRFFIPANEYPGRAATYLDIGLDVLVLCSLIMLRKRVFQVMEVGDPRRSFGNVLFWVALAAAISLLAIRFLGGEAQWWTGHRLYELSPR